MHTYRFEFDAIGTTWRIDASGEVDADTLEAAIHARIEAFDSTYSRFRKDSLITAVQNTGTYTFPEDGEALFAFYRQLYDVTSGKVTPLIGSLLVDAGYDASYSLRPKSTLRPVAKWDEALSYEHPKLTVREPVLLDFGAAGKGYLVDLIAAVLDEYGITTYLIDAGGDMLRKTTGDDTIRVGLEHPSDPTLAVGVATLGNGSLCGSAPSRRQWAGLHHIMDPNSLSTAKGTAAVWVLARSAMLADGLTTALFFESAEKLQQSFTFEYCLLKSDMTAELSPGFPAELFIDGRD